MGLVRSLVAILGGYMAATVAGRQELGAYAAFTPVWMRVARSQT